MWTILALLVALAGPAHAQPAALQGSADPGRRAAAPAGPAPPASTADLDGLYLALGPVGGGAVGRDGWTATFGGEVMVVRVRERSALAALGLTAGAVRYADLERGRLWLDLLAATRRPLDLAIGLQAGPVVEVDELRPPRAGFQGALWLYAGIVPYLRAGVVQKSGPFMEIGLRIPLPALRW